MTLISLNGWRIQFLKPDSAAALVGHITTVGRLQTAEISALWRGAKARNDSFVNFLL